MAEGYPLDTPEQAARARAEGQTVALGQNDERLWQELATLKAVAQTIGYVDAAVFLGRCLTNLRTVGAGDQPTPETPLRRRA